MSELTFKTDCYADQLGRVWRCVADQKKRQMICREEHSFTVASFETFKRWGWVRESPQGSPDA